MNYEKSVKERIGNGENPDDIKHDIINLSIVKDDKKEVDRLCKLVDQAAKSKKK